MAATNTQVIVHIDPAIGSTNLGDEIISEAVTENLKQMFDGCRIIRVASRDVSSWATKLVNRADYTFLGGTNALSSNPIFGYRQFAIGFTPPIGLRKIILFGVGWWQYQDKYGPFAKLFYKNLLDENHIHSVRDNYTAEQLKKANVRNVINTACPTMWNLASFDCAIPETAVITLTDYHQNHSRDTLFLKAARERFNRILYWPQGLEDAAYLQHLTRDKRDDSITILPPTLSALDNAFEDGASYVGTRLHAGIRALQHHRPSFIIPIDNRALEIAKSESLTLTSESLENIQPGAKYILSHTQSPMPARFMHQFR